MLAQGEGAHHIMFDDNIERDRAHIVDIRCADDSACADAKTGELCILLHTRAAVVVTIRGVGPRSKFTWPRRTTCAKIPTRTGF